MSYIEKGKVMADLCHCGRPVKYGFDGNPNNHRGMCSDCDLVRCDAYPDECPYPTVNLRCFRKGAHESHEWDFYYDVKPVHAFCRGGEGHE